MTGTRPIIYFDIDNTLIETSSLISSIAIRLVSRGLAAEEFESAVTNYYQNLDDTTNFDPQELITLLAQRSEIDPVIIEQEFYNPAHFVEALFPEVVSTLEAVSTTHVLGIFSQGNHFWQEQKLSLSGIDRYFDPRLQLISERKLSEEDVRQLTNACTVIDDKYSVITTLASKRPDLQLFWLNRAAEEPVEALAQTITQVTSLAEVIRKLT